MRQTPVTKNTFYNGSGTIKSLFEEDIMDNSTLNQNPTEEEKIYFKVMTKATDLFTQTITESSIPEDKKHLAIVKSSLFTAAALIFQQAKEENMNEKQIDDLANDSCRVLIQAIKGIYTGAQALNKQ